MEKELNNDNQTHDEEFFDKFDLALRPKNLKERGGSNIFFGKIYSQAMARGVWSMKST